MKRLRVERRNDVVNKQQCKRKDNLEQRIQNHIRQVLTLNGYTVFRGNVGKIPKPTGGVFNTGLPAGFPDLFGFTKEGRMFFIEVKTPKSSSKLRDTQIRFRDMYLKKSNCIYGVARSAEEALKIVDEELQNYGY